MINQGAIKDFFLGRGVNFKSISHEKRALLSSQIAFLALFISLFFTVFDLIVGYSESFTLYMLLSSVGISSILLIRNQHYVIGKTLLILGANLVIFLAYEQEGYGTGTYAFFIPSIMASFAVFGYEDVKVAIGLFLISVALFLISTYMDFSWIHRASFSDNRQQLYLVNNYVIALFTCLLIIIFLVKLNFESESKLTKTGEELLANKMRFDLAIKGSSVGIWDWDIINDVLFLSPLLLEQLGYPEEKYQNMTSENFNRVLHPEDQEEVRQRLKSHLTSGAGYYHEFRIRKGDDSYFWVLVSGQAQWDVDGKPIRMIGTVVDITDSKESLNMLEEKNKQLEKANDELDRFVYSTSHDLKAPLSSISGLVAIANLSNSPGEVQECLSLIQNRVETMNGFIAEIIDYSRNTRLEVKREPIDLKELITQLIEGLHYYNQSESIRFENEVSDLMKINTDRSRLKIILNNLISNAIKYHDLNKNDPFILVTAKRNGEMIDITVEDNGQGIPKPYHSKLFNMFFRASESSDGSGLGLYIAKEMILKLGGQIDFISNIREGSTFRVSIKG